MTELLPCPFCGGEAQTLRNGSWWCVACRMPFCCDIGKFGTEDEAIAAWNTRAAMEFDNWFYLPKPREDIADIAETVNSFDGEKWTVQQFFNVHGQAAINWAKELDEHIIKRICEVWNTRTDDYRQAAEYWQRMYEGSFNERTCHDTGENEWHFVCSACGYEQNGYEQWNYCSNCGAKVVGE